MSANCGSKQNIKQIKLYPFFGVFSILIILIAGVLSASAADNSTTQTNMTPEQQAAVDAMKARFELQAKREAAGDRFRQTYYADSSGTSSSGGASADNSLNSTVPSNVAISTNITAANANSTLPTEQTNTGQTQTTQQSSNQDSNPQSITNSNNDLALGTGNTTKDEPANILGVSVTTPTLAISLIVLAVIAGTVTYSFFHSKKQKKQNREERPELKKLEEENK